MKRLSTTLLTASLLVACGQEVRISTDSGNRPDDDPSKPDFDTDDDDDPVAVCAARPNPAEPSEPVDFVGEGSYDPDGSEIISYVWQLPTVPSGSRARLPSGQANRTGFVPDVLGTYVATLTVTDESGARSTVCSTELDVQPSQDLYVELQTTYEKDDLELVVVRNGDLVFPPFGPNCRIAAADDTCAGKACDGIDWGQANNAADDPVVISDDDQGGTEAIAIAEPATGVFSIGVYDRSSGFWLSDHDATVAVYINGVRKWAGTKTLVDECKGAAFVKVAWPSGATTPL